MAALAPTIKMADPGPPGPSLALAPRPARSHTDMAEGCVWGCVCYKLVTLIERVLRGVAEGRSRLGLPQQQAEWLLPARHRLWLQWPPGRRAAGGCLGATGRPATLPGRRAVETGRPRLGGRRGLRRPLVPQGSLLLRVCICGQSRWEERYIREWGFWGFGVGFFGGCFGAFLCKEAVDQEGKVAAGGAVCHHFPPLPGPSILSLRLSKQELNNTEIHISFFWSEIDTLHLGQMTPVLP